MSAKFKINNFLDTYKPTVSSEIGRIYVDLDNYPFPEKEWIDFGTQIVFWWMQEFIKLLEGKEKKIKCRFMDGPFRFDIEDSSPDIWRVQFVEERSKSDNIEKEGEVSCKQINEEILLAVEDIQGRFEKAKNTDAVHRVDTLKQNFIRARHSNSIKKGF